MYPGKTAFVIDGIAYSYKELFACVNGIHAFLDGREEEVIGVVAENRIETYAAILVRENVCHTAPALPGQPE